MRGVTVERFKIEPTLLFQLTRLMRGVTETSVEARQQMQISTHTPHARRDGKSFCKNFLQFQFQLTRLMRGVTVGSILKRSTVSFQLTRLMRGVTPQKDKR